MKRTTGGDPRAYLDVLREDSPRRRAEWQDVLRDLMIGESFFFRDAAQFRLLRESLLPRLIERHAERRTLRVWSAGCSTGEEPYSLAILIAELVGPHEWDVSIVGSDVNDAALEHARSGEYSPWSLRGVPETKRERYFTSTNGRFRLKPEYRRMVTFQRVNLVKDRIPSFASGLHDMDLILCRNVFIYFGPETTGHVVEKLGHALAPGGFLLTGHAELQGHALGVLRTRLLPGSVVHERPAFQVPPSAVEPSPAPPAPPSRAAAQPPPPNAAGPSVTEPIAHAEAAFRRADYEEAARAAEAHLEAWPEAEGALRLAAAAAANLGQHVRAARHCRRLLEARPLDIEARYLLAKLAEDRGSDDEARALLDALLADAPSFVPAYLDLAWLEDRAGESARADALREQAVRMLDRLPRSKILSAYVGVTVEDLLQQLRPTPHAEEIGGEAG